MKAGNKTVGLRVRVVLEPQVAIGPGKADLLEGIAQTGSIAAAGRRMNMSYKRAWLLAESLNETFQSPLIESVRGGNRGGGAQLTELGVSVLEQFRRIESNATAAVAADLDQLASLLRKELE